jgi:hypothetical protein
MAGSHMTHHISDQPELKAGQIRYFSILRRKKKAQ